MVPLVQRPLLPLPVLPGLVFWLVSVSRYGVVANPRICLDHHERRPNCLRCGNQLCCSRVDRSAWSKLVWNRGGKTPQLANSARFTPIELPFTEAMTDVPIIGPIYVELLSGHNILVYFAFVMVPITWWVLFRTRFGLRLRAVGENPSAVDTAGISVVWARYRAVIICGILCGIAGAYLSIAQSAGFGRDMTAGKGFIALAALIFAKWKPVNAMFACLLFGFLEALDIRFQGVELPIVGVIPVQLMQALPYILTVVLLAGFIGKAIPPKASGSPYVKER